MKIHLRPLLGLLLISTAFLTSTAEAQFIRTPNNGLDMRARMEAEARARAAAEADARARAIAENEEERRQTTIVRELQCLQNTASVLQQSFASHLRKNRRSPSAQESELARALADLTTDVNHLNDDVYGRCSKCARGDYPHVYRSFHLMEYAAEDAQTLAFQAGYGRSLESFFEDIDQHITQLASTGLRNPRLQRIEKASHFHGRPGSKNEQQIIMPAVPSYPIATPEPRRPGPNPEPNTKIIDLGDVFGRIFGKK